MSEPKIKDFEKMVSAKEHRYINHIQSSLSGKEIRVIDVGANKGHYSEYIIKAFSESLEKIYAFEPVPRFYEVVRDKYAGNNIVEVINSACSEKKGKEEFFEIINPKNEDAEGLSSLNFRDVYNNFNHEKIEVDCIKLDDFLEERGVDNISFVKIDTEGHELSVLSGAKRSLDKGVFDFIQIEYGDCIREAGKDLVDILGLLSSTEYKIYDLVGDNFVEIQKENLESYKKISWDNYLVSKHKLD